MTRRGFLRHTGRLAASGLTAAAIADRLAKDTTAQNVRKAAGRRPQRVAVIGVDHYHATSTPNYLRILQNEKVDILGVHAPDDAIAAKWAGEYNSTPYTDYRVMIEKTKPEFIVALGKHVAMPAEFRFLVDTGIPFLMEKPWGIDDKTVNELADLAESKHAWAAVPMPFRYSLFAETARRDASAERARDDLAHAVPLQPAGCSTVRRSREPMDAVEGRRRWRRAHQPRYSRNRSVPLHHVRGTAGRVCCDEPRGAQARGGRLRSRHAADSERHRVPQRSELHISREREEIRSGSCRRRRCSCARRPAAARVCRSWAPVAMKHAARLKGI